MMSDRDKLAFNEFIVDTERRMRQNFGRDAELVMGVHHPSMQFGEWRVHSSLGTWEEVEQAMIRMHDGDVMTGITATEVIGRMIQEGRVPDRNFDVEDHRGYPKK